MHEINKNCGEIRIVENSIYNAPANSGNTGNLGPLLLFLARTIN